MWRNSGDEAHADSWGFRARFAVRRVTRDEPIPDAAWTPEADDSFEELIQRIEDTIEELEQVKESDFEGKEGKEVILRANAPTGLLEIRFTACKLYKFLFHSVYIQIVLEGMGHGH